MARPRDPVWRRSRQQEPWGRPRCARRRVGGSVVSVDPYLDLPLSPLDELGDEAWTFERAVVAETRRIHVREAARAAVAAEKRSGRPLPPVEPLRGFLAEPDPPTAYRIERVWPAGGRVVLAAAQKAGKSTAVGNVLRSLADGDALFGHFPAHPVGRVVLLDNELDRAMLRRWLRDHRIGRQEVVDLVPLRGRLSTFDVLDAGTRAAWAEHLGAADVLVLDCLRPALDALGLDENRDAGRFLEAFDELLTEAGIGEALVVHHHGHGSERSRGDSRILDWPDAVWNLVREARAEPTTASRYFSAYGRDVAVRESRLEHDVATRRLTVAGGSRGDRKVDDALEDVLEVLDGAPPMSGREVERALETSGHGRATVREALRQGVTIGLVVTVPGPRRSMLHALDPSSAPVRQQCATSAPAQ